MSIVFVLIQTTFANVFIKFKSLIQLI